MAEIRKSALKPATFTVDEDDWDVTKRAKKIYNMAAEFLADDPSTAGMAVADLAGPLGMASKIGRKAVKTPLFLRSEKESAKELARFKEIHKRVQTTPDFLQPEKVGSRQLKYVAGDDKSLKHIFTSLHDWDAARVRRMQGRTTWTEKNVQAAKLAIDDVTMRKLWTATNKKGMQLDDIGIQAFSYRMVDAMMEVKELGGKLAISPNDLKLNAQYMSTVANSKLWVDKYLQASTKSGRTLRSLADKSAEATSITELIRRAGGVDNMFEWAQDTMQGFSMLDISDMDAMAAFVKRLPETKYSNWDKVFFAVQNGWLSGAPTAFRNFFGNTSMLLTRLPETAIAGAVDSLIGTRTKRRGIYSKELTGDVVGFMHGIKEGVPTAFRHAVDTVRLKELAIQTGITQFEEARFPIKGKWGEFIGAPMKSLTIADQLFKTMAGNMEMNALAINKATRKGLKGKAWKAEVERLLAEPTVEMQNLIAEEQLYRTFQNRLGRVGNRLMAIRNDVPGVRYIAPFVRTPTNIIKAAFERMPGVSAGVLVSRWRSGAYKGWNKNWLAQRQLSKDISKSVVGNMVAAYFVQQYVEGKMTGPMPKGNAERQLWRDNNIQPNSIVTADGKYIPVGNIIQEPFGLVIDSALHVVGKSMEQGEDITAKDAASIALSFANSIADMSSLRGLADFTAMLADTDRKGIRYLQKLPTYFVPFSAAVASVARLNDSYYRKPETTLDVLKTRIPGLSKQVAISRGPLGQKRKRPGSAMTRAFAPFQVTKKPKDIVINEMTRLYETENFLLSFPSSSLTSTKWDIEGKMDVKEYNQFLDDQGKVIRDTLAPLFRSPQYQQMADQEKVRLIKKIARKSRADFRQQARVRWKLREAGLKRK